jgi:hypothetical protein
VTWTASTSSSSASAFEVERLLELYAPDDAETQDHVTPEWARKWPAEEIWVARKRAN